MAFPYLSTVGVALGRKDLNSTDSFRKGLDWENSQMVVKKNECFREQVCLINSNQYIKTVSFENIFLNVVLLSPI